jgi:hypothetical protein
VRGYFDGVIGMGWRTPGAAAASGLRSGAVALVPKKTTFTD